MQLLFVALVVFVILKQPLAASLHFISMCFILALSAIAIRHDEQLIVLSVCFNQSALLLGFKGLLGIVLLLHIKDDYTVN